MGCDSQYLASSSLAVNQISCMKTQLTGRMQRTSRRVLLLTSDPRFEEQLLRALSPGGAVILVTRTFDGALETICRCAANLDFAVIDFVEGRHGMTLLNAIHTIRANLPIVAVFAADVYDAAALAYANGAAACLAKPVSTADIELAFQELLEPKLELTAA
jgi:ActR/RegA family two-component response regulator